VTLTFRTFPGMPKVKSVDLQTPGIAYAFHPDRDARNSALFSQPSWWIPVSWPFDICRVGGVGA
jgi:hypothetical protein